MSDKISLTKGQNINLSKEAPGLTKVTAGAGWDPANEGKDIDLDLLAIYLGEDGKALPDANANGTNADEALVFFNNLELPGAKHHGDNLTGQGEGDDEQITFDLAAIPESAKKVVIVIASYSGEKFGEVKNAFVRLVNASDDKEIARYDLADQYADTRGVAMGELTREGSEWKFTALGQARDGDFNQILKDYGITS